MRRMNRVLIGVIAALLLLAAGCGDISPPSPTPTGSVSAEPTQTLSTPPSPTPSVSPSAEPTPPLPELPILKNPNAPTSAPEEFDDAIMPAFTLPLVGGGEFTLSEEPGKPVFVHLFATWCGSCWLEMPHIEKLYRQMSNEADFVIIAVGEDEAIVKDFADSQGFTLPFAYSEEGSPFSGYSVQFVPQTFIVNAQGVITAFFPGPSSYENFYDALEAAKGE